MTRLLTALAAVGGLALCVGCTAGADAAAEARQVLKVARATSSHQVSAAFNKTDSEPDLVITANVANGDVARGDIAVGPDGEWTQYYEFRVVAGETFLRGARPSWTAADGHRAYAPRPRLTSWARMPTDKVPGLARVLHLQAIFANFLNDETLEVRASPEDARTVRASNGSQMFFRPDTDQLQTFVDRSVPGWTEVHYAFQRWGNPVPVKAPKQSDAVKGWTFAGRGHAIP